MIEKYGAVLTVYEMMEILKIGRSSAYFLLRSGAIPSRRIRKKYLIPTMALEKFLNVA